PGAVGRKRFVLDRHHVRRVPRRHHQLQLVLIVPARPVLQLDREPRVRRLEFLLHPLEEPPLLIAPEEAEPDRRPPPTRPYRSPASGEGGNANGKESGEEQRSSCRANSRRTHRSRWSDYRAAAASPSIHPHSNPRFARAGSLQWEGGCCGSAA